MTLKDLTDRNAVLAAMKEYDELGRQAFLEKYEFGTARQYLLVHKGRSYDSKALAGVAHLYQTGTLLRRNQFTGGRHGAARALESLGFRVDNATETVPAGPGPGAIELLWNPAEPWDDLGEYQQNIAAHGTASGRWSVGQTKRGIRPGDRVFLFRTGSGHGLMGSGHAATEIFTAPHWNPAKKDTATYITVAWDALVGSEDVLLGADIRQAVPDFPSILRVSGQRLGPEVSRELEELWQEHLAAVSATATGVDAGAGPEAGPAEIEADYRVGIVRRRNHQRAFRALLFQHYDPVCHVCGLDQIEILEAAHLVPDSAGGASSVENGRLLCPTHHRAHDAGLFAFQDGLPVWSDQAKAGLIPGRR